MMTTIDVYLEHSDEGGFIAHVLQLPGCFVRGESEEAVLAALPEAVWACTADWQRYGEPYPPKPHTFAIAERAEAGAAVRDQTASVALFTPEREPLSRGELEDMLRLAQHNRADLLALLRPLDDETLDWRPEPEARSIREIVDHIGRADRWYSTRVVDPDSVPDDWEEVTALPLLEFLDVERERVLERLRNLTDEQLRQVYVPRRLTGEQWTARKALRRLLMHERDHTAQIRELLAQREAGE